MNGGSTDGRRAWWGFLKPVGTSLAGFSRLSKNRGALGIVPRFYERRRTNTSAHKNEGNIATFRFNITTFRSSITTFPRVIILMSQR